MFLALAGRVAARQRRDDLRYGVVAAAAMNATRTKKSKPEPYRPDDFFPQPHNRSEARARIRATAGALVECGHARRYRIPAAEGQAIFADARTTAAQHRGR